MASTVENPEVNNIIQQFKDLKITAAIPENELKALLKELYRLYITGNQQAVLSQISSIVKSHLESLRDQKCQEEEISNVVQFFRVFAEDTVLTKLTKVLCPAQTLLVFANVLFPHITSFIHSSKAESHAMDQKSSALLHKTVRLSVTLVKSVSKLKLKSKNPQLLEHLTHLKEIPDLINNEHVNAGEGENGNSSINSNQLNLEVETEGENTSSILHELGLVFLSLMNNHPHTTLDIKYNAGLILCYLVSQEFLDDLFCTKTSSSSGEKFNQLETAVREYVNSDFLNKLSLCYGCLQICGDFTPEFMSGIAAVALEQSDNSTKEAINLGSARVLETWIQKVSPLMPRPQDLNKLTPVFKLVEIFSFTYIAGHIDAVKNCCRNMLRDLSNIYSRLDTELNNGLQKENSLLNDLLLTIISKPYNIKWIALAMVTRKNPNTIILLDLFKEAPEKMLCAERSHKSSASEAYISLMKYTFSTMENSTWIKTWISPLFRVQPSQKLESNWAQKKYILGKVINVKSCDTGIQQCILKEIVGAMSNSNGSSESAIGSDTSNLLLSTESSCLVVECLKIGAELGIKINPFQNENVTNENQNDFFRGVLPRHIMNSWTSHANPQIRLASFELLVDTKKTSELLTGGDFETIKLILKYNLVSQNPAFRQQFLSHFKKLMRRLKDGKSYAARTRKDKDVANYNRFITWAWNFLITDGLFAGANFSRRAQALNCLAELRLHFKIEDLQESEEEKKQTEEEALTFLPWLDDSYENNKMAAVEILSKIDIKILNDKNFCESLYSKALIMLTSVRPPDSVTARHILLLLLKKSFITPLNLIEKIVLKLEETLTMTKETSLLELTTTCPPYGMFRSLRHILNAYQKEILEEALLNSKKENASTISTQPTNCVTFQSLQLLFQRLLNLSIEFDTLLLPVLGSSAPEGFLPALSKQAKKDIPSEEYNIVRSINAQMLLVGSWRSMKEICILLIEICVAFPLEGEPQSNTVNGIVTEETKSLSNSSSSSSTDYVFGFEQVEKIGVHLVHLLMNLMHRGVFEQVFVGFKSLVHRLKKSRNECLNKLAHTWLDEIMNDKSRVGDKCVTRRSAGLPYIFQAILTPEIENEDFIKYWMEKLMEYNPVTVVRIHSMNILRGLYKDANFSRALMQWVPQGIELAFRGLRATEWGERNSGLMLFGAVIRRTFGPKLNLMSAPTFFRKFPQMYDFLLREIKATANISGFGYKSENMNPSSCKSEQGEGKNQQDNNDFAYYILLLFSCFSNAPGKLEEGNFKLLEFIPYIQACGGNSDIQVRTIAAKSIVPFITSPPERTRVLESSLDNLLFHSRRIRNNLIHGDLLQLISLVKLFQTHEEEIPSNLIEKFQLIIDIVKNTKCPVIFELFAELSITLADSISIPQNQSNSHLVYTVAHTMQKVTESAFSVLYPTSFDKGRNSIAGLVHADLAVCRSILRFCVFENSNDNDNNIRRWIKQGAKCIVEELLSILIMKQEQQTKKEKGQNDSENGSKVRDDDEGEEVEAASEKQQSSFKNNTSVININMNIIPEPLLLKRYLKEDFHFTAQTDYEYKFLVYFSNCRVEEFHNGEETCSNEEIIQVMDQLVDICQGEFGSVPCRATALKFLSKLAFHETIQGGKYKEIICSLFVELSDTTYDDEIRLAVAQSIPSLPLNLNQFSAEEFSKIWISLFKLALDDEIFIRDEAFKRLKGNREVPGCNLKCLEMLVEVFFNQIKNGHSIEAIWSLIALLMTEDFDVMNCSAEDDDEDRLFDKSEMNLFRETVTLTNIIYDYLIVHQDILNILKTRLATTLKENPKGYQLYTTLINSRTNQNNNKNETVPKDNDIDISNLDQLKNVLVNYTSEEGRDKQDKLNNKEQVSLLTNFHNNSYDDNFLSKLLSLHHNDKSVVNTYIRGKIECLFLSN